MKEFNAIIVGCGLSGAVVGRFLAEEMNKKVLIIEKRDHIGGNMYDYKNEDGILVHQYGPHTFHTKKKFLYDYMCQYAEWEEYKLTCGAVINGKYTPTPFNFQTIDDFFDKEKAEKIKQAIAEEYPGRSSATVVDALESTNALVKEYAQFLFDYDYSLYTAKQWGIRPEEIDPSVLKRVPLRFSYDIGYFDDEYQVMPRTSYTEFFEKLLAHENICVKLETQAKDLMRLDAEKKQIFVEGEVWDKPLIYTGAIDELMDWKYGELPYRSLRFEWKTENRKSLQDAPVVAYPQAPGYTRITEYTKLPVQEVGEKTTYAVEYPLTYQPGQQAEPYYPIPNEENHALYKAYREKADAISNLHLCGRLAEYQYYNMDQALENALELCEKLKADYETKEQ